jgi:mono/diheme cytochrome c family protein
VGDAELTRILRSGIPGTAMPFFSYYTENQLGSLVRFLREPMGLKKAPEPVEPAPSPAAQANARKVFEGTCSVCHGRDGRRTQLSLGFRPQPPDLTVYALSPSRELEVITNGYPGTMMRSFVSLPEPTRQALVEQVHSFYREEP